MINRDIWLDFLKYVADHLTEEAVTQGEMISRKREEGQPVEGLEHALEWEENLALALQRYWENFPSEPDFPEVLSQLNEMGVRDPTGHLREFLKETERYDLAKQVEEYARRVA